MMRCLLALVAALLLAAPVHADSPAAPVMRLLKSGRVPAQRLPAIVEMICQRGDAADLQYIYEQAIAPDGYQGEVRLTALKAMARAAATRNVKPAGDVSGLAQLIQTDDLATQLAAIELAGHWQAESLLAPLKELALDEKANLTVRQTALGALTRIGGPASQQVLQELTAAEQPFLVRSLAVGGLAQVDVEAAAVEGAKILAQSKEADDLQPLLAGFLSLQGGPEQFAAAVAAQPPPQDTAKLALRTLYASGRTDAPLVQALSDAAGMTAEVAPPTPEELAKLVAEVENHGDPARGEEIFRRAELSCVKCHAVSKAGGDIGPDLSPVGSNSPVDYLIRSILNPSQDIKEAYITTIILTVHGKQFQGIVIDRDEQRVVLKDANGETLTVPADEIDEEFEGKSLMPSGLANFMTRSELVDLVAFLSVLGKPGEYAIRSTETIQRWRVLKEVPAGTPHPQWFEASVLAAGEEAWEPAYAKTAGMLPLKELPGETLLLKGEVDVTEGGTIGVRINSTKGALVWVGQKDFGAQAEFLTELPRGRHALYLHINRAERGEEDVRVELFRPDGSPIQFEAVSGK